MSIIVQHAAASQNYDSELIMQAGPTTAIPDTTTTTSGVFGQVTTEPAAMTTTTTTTTEPGVNAPTSPQVAVIPPAAAAAAAAAQVVPTTPSTSVNSEKVLPYGQNRVEVEKPLLTAPHLPFPPGEVRPSQAERPAQQQQQQQLSSVGEKGADDTRALLLASFSAKEIHAALTVMTQQAKHEPCAPLPSGHRAAAPRPSAGKEVRGLLLALEIITAEELTVSAKRRTVEYQIQEWLRRRNS